MKPRTVFISFADLARLAPRAGLYCTERDGEFLAQIEYDDEKQGNMEEVEKFAGDVYDRENTDPACPIHGRNCVRC